METTFLLNSIKLLPIGAQASELYELLSRIYSAQTVAPPKIKGVVLSFQPLKNRINASYLQHRGKKFFSKIEYSASREIRQAKVHRLLGRMKIVHKMQIDYLPQKTIHTLYKSASKKTYGLVCNKFEGLPKPQREALNTRLREFKFIRKLTFQSLPDYRFIKSKESSAFKNSLKSLRQLRSLHFLGETIPKIMSAILSYSLSSNLKLQSLTASFSQLPMDQFNSLYKSLLKLRVLKSFTLQIPESFINDELNEKMKIWFSNLAFIENGILCISSSNLEKDLSCYNDYSFLAIKFKLNHGLSTVAANVSQLDKLSTPVIFDWNIIPTETLDYDSTSKILSKMSEYPKILGMNQSYFFDNENSELRGCFPLWASIMTHYNFQKIEILNLAILLSSEVVQKFFCIFGLSVVNMYNLKDLSLTFHNDGSSDKRFYIQEEIVEVLQILSRLTHLKTFEFNSEVEIIINILNDFFNALSQFQYLESFRSEWLQISTKSFRTLMKKLHQMEHLETLDIHIYSLTEIKDVELKEIFDSLDNSLVKMKNMSRVQITGDSDCFGNSDLWSQCESTLRKKFPNKVIELSLAQTE